MAATAGRNRLDGKVAIITGSNSGIGAGIAFMFAKEGALLSLTGRSKQTMDEVVKQCVAINGKKPVVTLGDISTTDVLEQIVKNTVDAYGRIDILVNNAGVGTSSSLLNFDLEKYNFVLDVNLRAPYHLTALCTPHLIKTQGTIVNISSIAAIKPFETTVPYCMAKAGMDMFTKCAAKELAPHQVRVNSVNPGYIHTAIIRDLTMTPEVEKKFLKFMASAHALGRNGTVEEIANVVTFLASSEASFMTGAIVPVDGGNLVHNSQGKNPLLEKL